MTFTQDAINALEQRRIRPYAVIETKLSTEIPSDPWHEITFTNGRFVHDSNEFSSELSFSAIDPSGDAVDPFREDAGSSNYLRTGSLTRLKIGVTYIDNSLEITEYRIGFQGFITKLNPFVDAGFWGVEVTAHDRLIRARDAVASLNKCADIIKVENELLITSDNKVYESVNGYWLEGMAVIRRTLSGETRQVSPEEFQVLEHNGGVEFFESQNPLAQIHADYYRYDASSLHVSEIIKLALEYASNQGGTGLASGDYDLADTSHNNPDETQRLPIVRFCWDETDGGPIEIYNHLLNSGLLPENLKFYYDPDDDKWRLEFIYQKDENNPQTPDFEPDFEVIRSMSFDDPADSEELYTRVAVVGKLHAPRNLAREGTINEYALPSHPGWTAGFKSPSQVEGASNSPGNIIDGSLNTQFMWILGDKVGEDNADGAITPGTESTAIPEFDPDHPYNEIATSYVDLGSIMKPSRLAVHIGSNRFGSDRNPGRPQMLVSIEVASNLAIPDDMDDPNWVPLSDSAFRLFVDANELIDLNREDFLVEQFRYIRVRFHFGLYYKWKPERRFIEFPIREMTVFEDDRIIGTDMVGLSRYPSLYERYQKRGYRTFIHEDSYLQTQDEVDNRASDLLDELVQNYLDRETTLAWDPRYRLHTPSTVAGLTVHGLTILETDPRYANATSRLVSRIEYDLDNYVVKISGTDYFTEVE